MKKITAFVVVNHQEHINAVCVGKRERFHSESVRLL